MFAEKAFEAQLISFSSTRLKFNRIYDEFKARLEFPSSAENLQTYYQRFLKVLDNLGKPVAHVSKSIATQLSTLTGKIYMYIERIGDNVFFPRHISNCGWAPL